MKPIDLSKASAERVKPVDPRLTKGICSRCKRPSLLLKAYSDPGLCGKCILSLAHEAV